ncbi:MAG: hypothetical protein WA919_01815 [Coleofasciculaceae cyanobacterium]
MTVVASFDLLADIYFIDYWDADTLLHYSGSDPFFDELDTDICPDDWENETSLDENDADI